MGAWRIHKESLTAQDTPGDRYSKRSAAGLRCSRADSVNPGLNFNAGSLFLCSKSFLA